MSQNELGFVILGQKDKILHQIFVSELVNYFGDLINIASVYDVNVDLSQVPVVNWQSFLANIENDYVILQQDDMIFYDNVDSNMIRYYLEVLKSNKHISCIKLSRSGISEAPLTEFCSGIYYIPDDEPYPFSLFATMWKKSDLIKLFEECQQYSKANLQFKTLKMNGCMAYNKSDTKRGMYHWENQFYPFMNTAIIDKKWNELEYSVEIENLKREYSI